MEKCNNKYIDLQFVTDTKNTKWGKDSFFYTWYWKKGMNTKDRQN